MSATTATRQFVYIRVRQALLLPPVPNPPAIPPPAGHFYALKGRFEDIQHYAGATVDWVIKIAHLICDPCGAGRVYTHTTGTPVDWYMLDRTSSWREVVQGDPLLPGIYEFDSTSPIVLSKISDRHSHSLTSSGSESSAASFRREIKQRDGDQCAVIRVKGSLVASHLIPKRMGSDGAKDAVTRFCGPQVARDVHRFDPRIGIFLVSTLDNLVNLYQLGFYHVTGNTYTLHNFDTNNPDLLILGVSPGSGSVLVGTSLPALHLHSTTLSVHNGTASLPPKGVFAWHYLQCVINIFGTPQYKNLPNIKYFVHPFKTASDDLDDEYTDDYKMQHPPCPSYCFDQFLAEQGKRQMLRERHEAVAQWSSRIPSSS